MKTLGICIPTYKRPDFLKRCVLSAIESAQGRPISVFIADDSVDSTNEPIYAELQDKYPFIWVHRNSKNLGIDLNIQQSVNLSDCDYTWMFGEDDTFLSGAIASVYDLLQTVDEPFVLVNYTFVGNDPSVPFDNALRHAPEGVFAASDFYERYLWAAGFLGGCVVSRTAWEATDPAPYVGTYYTHVGRIVEAIALAGKARVVSSCGVANRVRGGQDNFTWKDDSYGVFFSFLTMCRTAGLRLPQHAESLRRGGEALERRYQWLSYQVAIRLRSQGAYDLSQYHTYIVSTKMTMSKKIGFYFISIAPNAIFRPLVRIYRALKGSV